MSNDCKVTLLTRCQITHLTNMNDRERLRLLKDVAGTEVYEQKRAESTRIMEETGASYYPYVLCNTKVSY